MKKYYLLALSFLFLMVACNKTEFDKEVKGEALGNLQPTAPVSNSVYLLNAATPNEVIEFNWTPAQPGVSTSPTYSVIVYDENGSAQNPIFIEASDNEGKDNKKTFTHKSLSDLLISKGIAAGTEKNLFWVIKATNGTVEVLSEANTINVTTAKDGATKFLLLSPANSNDLISLNPTSSTDILHFKWTQSFASAGSPAIKYTVVLTPTTEGAESFRIEANNGGLDTSLSISHEALSTLLADAGYQDLAQVLNFNWTVEAKTGNFLINPTFENLLAINREVNMYLVGTVNGWNIDDGIKMISDKRNLGNVFYSYIEVKDQTVAFKFFSKLGDWGSGYGETNQTATNGGIVTGYNQGGDIIISTPGIYRLTIDLENNIYYIQERQVGIVGDVPANNWNDNSPLFGKFIGNNSFEILVEGTAGKQIKLHEGGGWDSGLPYQTRYYGTSSVPGRLVEPGDNIELLYDGVNKVIFDGSNPHQLKYSITQHQMKMRGGNEFGGWGFNEAIAMTYEGNGVWKGLVTLASDTEFKFCGTDDWSINYGKSSTPNLAEFNGSTNFNIGAGSWQITFNEFTLAYSIAAL